MSKLLSADTFGRMLSRLRTATKGGRLVAVTGGAGYVGSLVVRRLLDSGCRVRVLDSLRFGGDSLRDLEHRAEFELIAGDIRDERLIARSIRGVESVIHLAAIVGERACDEDPSETLAVNYDATRGLLKVSLGEGVERFVFASTCSVYGRSGLSDETSPTRPMSLYASTKLDAEAQVLAASGGGFQTTALRLGTLFGISPRPRFDLVVNLLAAQAAARGTIRIDGQHRYRPFLHVDDAARAFVRAIEAPVARVGGRVFCVGGEELNCQLGELADRIREVVPEVEVRLRQVEDRPSYEVDFSRIRQELHFKPNRSLASGIAEIVAAIADGTVQEFEAYPYHNALTAERAALAG